MTITDETGSVRVTLWGQKAQEFALPDPAEGNGENTCVVVAISNIRVKEFRGAFSSYSQLVKRR